MNIDDILNGGFSNVDILKNAPEQKVKKDFKDHRFWKITKDKNGDGKAVIRLLTDKNKIPFVRIYHYSAQKLVGDKKYYLIANSPDSIGLPCPIKEHYFELMNQGLKDETRMFSRKVKYYTNIYVEKDPSNPENEGKVFLWEFGQKLLDKFTNWMKGDPEMGESGKEVFNPLNGNSIKLVINKNPNTGFYEYDRTDVFPNTSSVGNVKDKNKIVDILLNQTYDLNEFKSPQYFEPYEDIKQRLNYFLNPSVKVQKKEESVPQVKEDIEDSLPAWAEETEEVKVETPKKETKVEETKKDDWMDDFEDMFSE